MELPALHEQCEPLAILLGTWVGDGAGAWEGVEPFRFREELTFTHNGKPFVSYTSRTWDPVDDRPMHSESGYLRPTGGGAVELIVAQPTGLVEVSEGVVTEATLELASVSIVGSSTAKPVTDLRRSYLVVDRLLTYEIRMATPRVELRWHLTGELVRS